MKTVDLVALLNTGVLKVLLKRRLPAPVQKTIFKLLDWFQQVSADELTTQKLAELEKEVNEILALVELNLPLTMQVLSFHLLHYVCEYLHRYDILSSIWMAYLERYNNFLCSLIHNQAQESILASYQLADFGAYVMSTQDSPSSDAVEGLLLLYEDIAENCQVKPLYGPSHLWPRQGGKFVDFFT